MFLTSLHFSSSLKSVIFCFCFFFEFIFNRSFCFYFFFNFNIWILRGLRIETLVSGVGSITMLRSWTLERIFSGINFFVFSCFMISDRTLVRALIWIRAWRWAWIRTWRWAWIRTWRWAWIRAWRWAWIRAWRWAWIRARAIRCQWVKNSLLWCNQFLKFFYFIRANAWAYNSRWCGINSRILSILESCRLWIFSYRSNQ